MKTTKPVSFTPGEWGIRQCDNGVEVNADTRQGKNLVAHVFGLFTDEQEANARLIAASPCLLEALEQCVTDDSAVCFTHQETRPEYMVKRLNTITAIARAAIAKATGGQP